jgi:hypothetical protein
MGSEPNPGNRRTRKSVTVKAAWIGGGCVVAAAIITAVLPMVFHGNSSGSNSSVASSVSPVPAVSSSVPDAPLVAVRREMGFSEGCGSWIVPKAPQDVSPPPLGDQWIAKNQAIDATNAHLSPAEGNITQDVGVTNLDVTVQGPSSVQIILTGIQFVIAHKGYGTINGGVVTNACGGPLEARYMVVDLDNSPANIVTSVRDPFPAPSDEPWQGTPVTFPYYVSETSSEVFKIIAFTHEDVAWYAELFWSVDGKNGQSIISDGGKPFETAALSRATAVYGYNGHSWYVCSKSVSAESITQCAVT